MALGEIKFLQNSEIEAYAANFTNTHNPQRSIPVPIEEIVDIK